MSRQVFCMNKLVGCSGIVFQKGEMYCEECLKIKKENKDNMQQKNKNYEINTTISQENISLKKQIELQQEKILSLQRENEKLKKDNSLFSIKYEQLKIDYERNKLN